MQVTATLLPPHVLVRTPQITKPCTTTSSYVIRPLPLRQVVNKGRHVVQWSTWRRRWEQPSFFFVSIGSYHDSPFPNQYVLLLFQEMLLSQAFPKNGEKTKPKILWWNDLCMTAPLLLKLDLLCTRCSFYLFPALPLSMAINKGNNQTTIVWLKAQLFPDKSYFFGAFLVTWNRWHN